MLSRIRIVSNFVDYYDYLADDESKVVYNRMMDSIPTLGTALRHLRKLGIKTIEIGTVRDMAHKESKLMVYYNGAMGVSKEVMDSREALLLYPNYLASRAYGECEIPSMYRCLQVGKLKYCIKYNESGGHTAVEYIKELKSGYNKNIAHPIFSIDYIATNDGMLAVDFSIDQRLADTGIDSVLSPKIVINELYQRIWLNSVRG